MWQSTEPECSYLNRTFLGAEFAHIVAQGMCSVFASMDRHYDCHVYIFAKPFEHLIIEAFKSFIVIQRFKFPKRASSTIWQQLHMKQPPVNLLFNGFHPFKINTYHHSLEAYRMRIGPLKLAGQSKLTIHQQRACSIDAGRVGKQFFDLTPLHFRRC